MIKINDNKASAKQKARDLLKHALFNCQEGWAERHGVDNPTEGMTDREIAAIERMIEVEIARITKNW